MSIPHVHLALTHAPIFTVLIGVAVLIAALLRRSSELRMTAYALFVIGALVTVPVFLSGEGSERALEDLAGVSEAVIDAHAAAAKVSLAGIGMLGLLSLFALLTERWRRELIVPAAAVLVIFGGLTSASLAYTANLGGQIRHAEIRSGAASTNPTGETAAEQGDGAERAGPGVHSPAPQNAHTNAQADTDNN